jgi:hypothetical protein
MPETLFQRRKREDGEVVKAITEKGKTYHFNRELTRTQETETIQKEKDYRTVTDSRGKNTQSQGKRGNGGKWEEIPKTLFVFPSFPFSLFPLLHKGLNLRK